MKLFEVLFLILNYEVYKIEKSLSHHFPHNKKSFLNWIIHLKNLIKPQLSQNKILQI